MFSEYRSHEKKKPQSQTGRRDKLNSNGPVVAAWVYSGWHPCAERDTLFISDSGEWEMVLGARPHFEGHNQPRLPAFEAYDDSRPQTASWQTGLARRYGIDMFVYGIFWSRGKRVLEKALDQGFLGADTGFPFAVMWANRMPRGVKPVKAVSQPVIDPGRLVHTDPDDFLDFISHVCSKYFCRENYFHIHGAPFLAIFDSTFFIRQMGETLCASAIGKSRALVQSMGYPDLHLVAVNPVETWLPVYRRVGFDAVTHYVLLPHWKGEYLQDYQTLAYERAASWDTFRTGTGLAYYPSVATGWDATPRGVIHAGHKLRQYPWWPVVTGEHPDHFSSFLKKAMEYSCAHNNPAITFTASLNEWSEGHYLEPDRRFGYGWLEAVRHARE